VPDTLAPLSPEWWMDRLYKRLMNQAAEAAFFNDYYTGNHPLPFVAPQARDEFRRLVQMTRSNYMGLVCDATAERLTIQGFRTGDEPSVDQDSLRIYQANELDTDDDMAWLEALISGRSYFHVAPNPKDRDTPHIWIEHASQAIVEHEPGTNRRVRAASLKVWDDDWTQEIHATLQLHADGGRIYKFRAPRPRGDVSNSPQWAEREVAGEQPNGQRMNPLKVVSMVEAPNNPRLVTGGVSELYDLTDIQDRVNKTLFDRLQTQEFGVDPQKWAKAFPDEDEDGNLNVVEFGRNRMVTTDIAETGFGNFAVAPLEPYSLAKREDVKDIASRSRTPAQYLLGEMSNVNGETLKASESGLISKVGERQRPFGKAAAEAVNIARVAAGLPRIPLKAWWKDPQYRTEGERTDAIVKRLQARIASLRQAREDYGYSTTEIARLEEDDEREAIDPIISRITRPPVTEPTVGDAGGPVIRG
jgi:hypothetical protein